MLEVKKPQHIRVVAGTGVAWIRYMGYNQYLPLFVFILNNWKFRLDAVLVAVLSTGLFGG